MIKCLYNYYMITSFKFCIFLANHTATQYDCYWHRDVCPPLTLCIVVFGVGVQVKVVELCSQYAILNFILASSDIFAVGCIV